MFFAGIAQPWFAAAWFWSVVLAIVGSRFPMLSTVASSASRASPESPFTDAMRLTIARSRAGGGLRRISTASRRRKAAPVGVTAFFGSPGLQPALNLRGPPGGASE